ncbi:unnamed protein product [Calicophoron daubneyi]|uniref:Activin types I and II receptor domain-containing protein n=1 Tax=Calicophoron daubneyi TaxID=300641 RepID=A0AAV2TU50_CALDB
MNHIYVAVGVLLLATALILHSADAITCYVGKSGSSTKSSQCRGCLTRYSGSEVTLSCSTVPCSSMSQGAGVQCCSFDLCNGIARAHANCLSVAGVLLFLLARLF